jgi:hypothetical protein
MWERNPCAMNLEERNSTQQGVGGDMSGLYSPPREGSFRVNRSLSSMDREHSTVPSERRNTFVYLVDVATFY